LFSVKIDSFITASYNQTKRISNMWCVILQAKGTSRNAVLPTDQKELLAPAAVGNILRRATAPELIGTYKWNGQILHLFGYKTGKAGTENKHELPPPHDKVLLFSDIVMIGTKANQMVSFGTTDYQKFYEEANGGFDELGSQDSDTDDDDENLEDDEEEVEEELEEEAEEDEEESVAESVVVEEEEEAPRPVVKPTAATKRNNKKLPHWYTHTQLRVEEYDKPLQIKGHATREHVFGIIKTRCGFLTPDEQVDFERGLYNFTIDDAKSRAVHAVWENPEFNELYLIHARRVITNLDPSSYIGNGRLLERFREKEFNAHDIPYMTYSDLYPEKWGAMIELAIKREAKMLEVDKSMATEMFKCSRCGKRQCTYYEMQTRSADEPMTQFIRCLNCGKQWRQ
jgi:DNA-directed RNA polymerase subunit M/transcription elongation factor TFIIS